MRYTVPPIDLALALALLMAAPFAFLAGRRGGRFRGMPGWVGFWVFFGGMLVALSRAKPEYSFPLLAVFMGYGLRRYFSLAPVRPPDRWAILSMYAAVPVALVPAYQGSYALFAGLFTVGVVLFLPGLLAISSRRAGLLDSMGRVLLGAFLFLVCAPHLGMLVHRPVGRLELFAILVVIAELPQRLAGRPRPGFELLWPAAGMAVAAVASVLIGAWVAPWGGATRIQGAVAGLLVAVGVAVGALVSEAVAHDLELRASIVIGRGAFLDRCVPAVFAAPLFYHYFELVS